MEPVIVVSGTPHEQGIQQGNAAGCIIAKSIDSIKKMLLEEKVDMSFYEEYIKRNAKFLEKNHPEQIEEIRGIAEGAKLPFTDLLMLNIPAYFLTKYFNQECSMLLTRGNATSDGYTYLIKNRDMSTYIEQLVLHRKLPGGDIIEVGGAGIISYPGNGINSHGLGLATTGFWSQAVKPDLEEIDNNHIFVNIRILLEECKTVNDVIERIKTYPRMNGLNIIAADLNDAVVIETTRDNMYIEKDNGSGILWRSNHYCHPDITHFNPPETEYPSTHKRFARIGEMITERQKKGKIRFQDMWRIMSDHDNGSNCICRHPQPGFPAWTVSSSLLVIEDRDVWTSISNPCLNLRYAKLG